MMISGTLLTFRFTGTMQQKPELRALSLESRKNTMTIKDPFLQTTQDVLSLFLLERLWLHVSGL